MPLAPKSPTLRRSLGILLALGLAGMVFYVVQVRRPPDRVGAPPASHAPAPRPAGSSGFIPDADAAHRPPAITRATSSAFPHLTTALAAILAEPDETLREAAWTRLEEQLSTGAAASDLPAIVDHCTRAESSEGERELGRRLLRRWAAGDAPAASAWTARLPAGAVRQQAVESVATLWANADMPAAIDWARRLPVDSERQGALLGIAYEAARTEPVSALSLALELPETRLRDDLLAHAAAQCAALAPAAAVEVAREFPDPLLRDRLLGAIATAWADTDPRAAAALALESIDSARLRDDALIGIIQRWAQKDASAASEWVATFPDGTLRETALDNLRHLKPPPTPETAK